MIGSDTGIGIGITEWCEVQNIPLRLPAVMCGISENHLVKIRKGRASPTVSTAFRLADSLDALMVDLYNIAHIRDPKWFIRQPFTLNNPDLTNRVNAFNDPERVKEYNVYSSPRNRCKVILGFQGKMAQLEKPVDNTFGKAEYYRPPTQVLPRPPSLPEELWLGEVYEALQRIKGFSARKIAQESNVSVGLLRKFQNNLSDTLINHFTPIAYTLGVTPDEFVYIAYPPKDRWPLLLTHGIYHDKDILARIAYINSRFSELSIEQRAEVMVAFKEFSHLEKAVAIEKPITLPSAFLMVDTWLLEPTMTTV